MATYLIKLTPHDKFFFGTGKDFGAKNENYFVKSRNFPQQTALLGMLRYQLLCQSDDETFKDNRIQDKTKAKALIGPSSFVQGKQNDFGKIKSISPVMICKGNDLYYPLPQEYQSEGHELLHVVKERDNFLLKGYIPKNGRPKLWSNGIEKISEKDIFQDHEQVGIRKKYEGGTDDKAFYMQTFKKFSDDYSFAFYATIDDSITLNKSLHVFLGGERQSFRMDVYIMDNFYESAIALPQNELSRVLLLSDAYIPSHDADFAINDTTDFSCLRTSVDDTEDYYSIKNTKETTKKEKSHVYHMDNVQLYTRGSVFYFNERSKAESFLNENEKSEFNQIGYNYFQII